MRIPSVCQSLDQKEQNSSIKAIELGGNINENGQWVLLRMTNPFTLLASNILNCDAELMRVIASCRSSNTVSRAVPLSKKIQNHSQIYLNETNIFTFLLEQLF